MKAQIGWLVYDTEYPSIEPVFKKENPQPYFGSPEKAIKVLVMTIEDKELDDHDS